MMAAIPSSTRSDRATSPSMRVKAADALRERPSSEPDWGFAPGGLLSELGGHGLRPGREGFAPLFEDV